MTLTRAITCLLALSVSLLAATAAGANAPAVTIDYRQSACAQRPFANTGEVRFFVRLHNNSGHTASFPKNISFLWLRPDGWKDSWLNSIAADELKVPAGRGKVYYADFGADPTKVILRCALRIGLSEQLHFVKVIR